MRRSIALSLLALACVGSAFADGLGFPPGPGTGTATGPIQFTDGTAASPSAYFGTDRGFFNDTVNNGIGWGMNGAQTGWMTANSIHMEPAAVALTEIAIVGNAGTRFADIRFSSDTIAAILGCSKGRGSNPSARAVPALGDDLCNINMGGFDGTSTTNGFQLTTVLTETGTVNSTHMGGQLQFKPTPIGSGTPTLVATFDWASGLKLTAVPLSFSYGSVTGPSINFGTANTGLYSAASSTEWDVAIGGVQSESHTASAAKYISPNASEGLTLYRNDSSPAAHALGNLLFDCTNSTPAEVNCAYIRGTSSVVTAGAELAQLTFATMGGGGTAGTVSTMLTLQGNSPATATFASGVGVTADGLNVVGSTIPAVGMFNSAGSLAFSDASAVQFLLSSSFRANNANGPLLQNAAGTCTAPSVVPNRAASTTGFSGDATNACIAVAATQIEKWASTGPAIVVLPTDATHTDASVCRDTTSGALLTGTGTLGICLGTSTRDLKANFADIDADWAKADKLDVNIQWTYKNDPSRIHYGPMVEDIAKVFPQLVGYSKAGKAINYDWPSLLFALQARDNYRIAQLEQKIAKLVAANDNLARRSNHAGK